MSITLTQGDTEQPMLPWIFKSMDVVGSKIGYWTNPAFNYVYT